jgi:hypothetical protein
MAQIDGESKVGELNDFDIQTLTQLLAESGYTQAEIENLRNVSGISEFRNFTLDAAAKVKVVYGGFDD